MRVVGISLKIKGVGKSFKKNVVLKDVNLEARGSEILGLVGKSGCGKSTLLKILVGYYEPEKGKILLNNKDISKDVLGLRRAVGYTTQENSFYEKLTVAENMNYYANLYRVPLKTKEGRIKNLLAQVGLLRHKKLLAEKISGGMKRRLDFAISLVHDPSILILDEPTTGLDPILVEEFWKIVVEIVKKGRTAIVISHLFDELEENCSRIGIMDKGKIIKILSKVKKGQLMKEFTGTLK